VWVIIVHLKRYWVKKYTAQKSEDDDGIAG
jgi:hypothetical protein